MTGGTKIKSKTKNSFDWFIHGILTKFGDVFDRFTGRGWKPSSSLATSELIERLKVLLDAEARDAEAGRKFVPHNIKLKMQWDKFSTDSEASLKKLENELIAAVIDHINDNRYHTYAPLELEIKPDYFTEGVKLLAGFDKFAEQEGEIEVNVTVPDLKNVVLTPPEETPIEAPKEVFTAEYTIGGTAKQSKLVFFDKKRFSVGRNRENDLSIEDASVSKIHASLVLSGDDQLLVSDTGSTNGTFVNEARIPYGKAFPINKGDKVKFGTVEVSFTRVTTEPDPGEIASEENLITEKDFSIEEIGSQPRQEVVFNTNKE